LLANNFKDTSIDSGEFTTSLERIKGDKLQHNYLDTHHSNMSIKEHSPRPQDLTPTLIISQIKQTKLLQSDFKKQNPSSAQKRTNIFIDMQQNQHEHHDASPPQIES